MGFWSKLFGGGSNDEAPSPAESPAVPTAPDPQSKERPAHRERRSGPEQAGLEAEGADARLLAAAPESLDWDTGYLYRYSQEEPARAAFERLRAGVHAVPNSRVELRRNLPRDAGGRAVAGTPQFLLAILTVHEHSCLEPRQAERLVQGGPAHEHSVARRMGGLRTELEATEALDAFETTRIATLPRHQTRLAAVASITCSCEQCGAAVTIRTRDIDPVRGADVTCEFCSRAVFVCPSIFDEPGENGLNPDYLERLLPAPRWAAP